MSIRLSMSSRRPLHAKYLNDPTIRGTWSWRADSLYGELSRLKLAS